MDAWAQLWNPQSATLALGTFGLLWLRLLPLTVLAPWFIWMKTPWILRIAVALSFALAFFPLAFSAHRAAPQSVWNWGACGIRELAIGMVFAVAASIPLYALEWTGSLLDTWRGAAEHPAAGQGPLEKLMLIMGVALFIACGGHRVAVAIFADTLIHLPPLEYTRVDWASLALGSGRLVADGLALTVMFSAPFIVALFIVEATLVSTARVSPGFPVSLIGGPARAGAILVVLLIVLATIATHLPEVFQHLLASTKTLLRNFAR
ncbi:MAG: flagellar biosynthetic protein FliR [Myxococcales bacterium]|nr:flagellar biosynthetic protein FliR [Myxococcales bacterium]MCB9708922.1 flagellar biosynthetic protein FliR [Myxococcales bacterium]